MPPSPRYVAEHFLMPRFLRERGAAAVLAAIEAKDETFFIPVWLEAGFQFTPRFVHEARAPFRVGLLSFPTPRAPTEAFFGVVIGRDDDPAFLRYFLLESSLDMDGKQGTIVGEWTETAHRSYGEGTPITSDFGGAAGAFVERVAALLAR